MASAATLKKIPLQPDDWVHAAFARLSAEGIEAVRVETLARDLGVSKGSFYWHFRDRKDLLGDMLTRWETHEAGWLEAAASGKQSPAARWAQVVEHSADPDRLRTEAAMRVWARGDVAVAARVAALENKRTSHMAAVLRDIGFTPSVADTWSQLALLVYLGWLDRASRDVGFQLAGRGLGDFLSELVLAASSRMSAPAR